MKHPSTIAALALASLAVTARGARANPAALSDDAPHAVPVSTETTVVVPGPVVRVGGSTGVAAADLFINLLGLGIQTAMIDEASHEHRASADAPLEQRRDYGYRVYREPYHEARQGLLFSFGLGGGSLRTTIPTFPERQGALDLDFRLGYGFSDRFQLFGDLDVAAASLRDGTGLASWTLMLKGQTVLIGDREGNGLNLNAGFGFGGLTQTDPYYGNTDSPVGLALGGGLSYDARIGRHFALSPELFYMWHEIPNGPYYANDTASTVGLRLNLTWYIY
jgi:hypothetical protein